MSASSNAVRIGRNSETGLFRLETEQFLPCSRERLFDFFADAFQLEALTPPWLQFAVLTPRPIVLQTGTLIDYRLRLHGVPIRWRTEIQSWAPPFGFVDTQLKGPYRLWHHRHRFEEVEGGTLCTDVVDYSVYGGRPIEKLFVRPDLYKIFSFRRRTLAAIFPAGVATS